MSPTHLVPQNSATREFSRPNAMDSPDDDDDDEWPASAPSSAPTSSSLAPLAQAKYSPSPSTCTSADQAKPNGNGNGNDSPEARHLVPNPHATTLEDASALPAAAANAPALKQEAG
ncbi:hypothetical protein ACEQ8H_006664 [Pleosporales sp. CAS-2024a]